MQKITEIINNLLKDNIDFVVVEILNAYGSTPASDGATMIVTNDKTYKTIGGGELEYLATLDARNFLRNRNSGEKRYDLNKTNKNGLNMVCGGVNILKFTYVSNEEKYKKVIDEFLEKLNEKINCYIFGAGHVGFATANLLNFIGMKITIYDDREEYANKDRFDKNINVICDSFHNIEKHININEDDFVIIMTREHMSDYEVEKKMLRTNAYYIGCIGSEYRHNLMKEKLINEDNFSKEDVERVFAPIGLKIGAQTPEEVAVSVVAEIILNRAKKENRNKYENGKTIWGHLDEYKI